MNRTILMTGSAALLLLGAGSVQAATAAATKDAGPVAQNSQAMAAADQTSQNMNIRQQLHDQLTKEGYTGVTITPSSFFVRAKDKAGNPVAMVIGPDTFTAVTELSPQKTAADTASTEKSPSTQQPAQK